MSSIDALTSEGAITLAVARSTGVSLDVAKIPISENVAAEFRRVLEQVVADIASRTAEPWTPEAAVDPETYLTATREGAGKGPKLSRGSAKRGTSLLEVLDSASGLPQLNPTKAGALALYAFVVGDDPAKRSIFIRRSNPRRGLGTRKVYATLGQTLVKIDDPILAFDDNIDIAVSGDQIMVLSQGAFAAIFRDNAQLIAQVPEWIAKVETHVPLAPGAADRLAAECARDSRLRRRLESINFRGHLASTTKEALRTSLSKNGFDTKVVLNSNGELVIDEGTDVYRLIQVLNEDRFFGDLTGSAFRADRKRPD